jgi:PHD/YefM family antitoxin component YafN of YafNO toxin-antitoxin module
MLEDKLLFYKKRVDVKRQTVVIEKKSKQAVIIKKIKKQVLYQEKEK